MFKPGEVAGRNRLGFAARICSAAFRLNLKISFFFAEFGCAAFRVTRMQVREQIGRNLGVPALTGGIDNIAPIGGRDRISVFPIGYSRRRYMELACQVD